MFLKGRFERIDCRVCQLDYDTGCFILESNRIIMIRPIVHSEKERESLGCRLNFVLYLQDALRGESRKNEDRKLVNRLFLRLSHSKYRALRCVFVLT